MDRLCTSGYAAAFLRGLLIDPSGALAHNLPTPPSLIDLVCPSGHGRAVRPGNQDHHTQPETARLAAPSQLATGQTFHHRQTILSGAQRRAVDCRHSRQCYCGRKSAQQILGRALAVARSAESAHADPRHATTDSRRSRFPSIGSRAIASMTWCDARGKRSRTAAGCNRASVFQPCRRR